MKYITIILLIIMSSVAVNAQSSIFGMTYDVSIPTGDTEKLISGVQWRGFAMEGRWYTSKNTSLGFAWHWNVFQETVLTTVNVDNKAVTGNQVRNINAFPFLMTGHFYFKGGSFAQPYLGLGAGVYFVKRRLDIGIYTLDEDKWQFGVSPEVGLLFPVDLGFNLMLRAKYHYAFETSSADAVTYFSVNVGFASIELF
jgi:opacity protein-like surface antigen